MMLQRLCGLGIAMILVCTACGEEAEVAQRLEQTRKNATTDTKYAASTKSRLMAKQNAARLQTMKVTAKTPPQILSAGHWLEEDGEIVVLVFWAEAKPTVEKLVFQKRDGRAVTLPVPSEYVQENREIASATVIFRARDHLAPKTEHFDFFASASPNELTVQLFGSNGTSAPHMVTTHERSKQNQLQHGDGGT